MKNTAPIHCFLIDDDPEEIDIFRLALEELDIPVKCTSFTDCREAIRALIRQEPQPDCIFVDLYMGATSGKECLNMIVTTEIISQIPTVILSGSVSGEAEELKRLGAQQFIAKAHTIPELKLQLTNYFTTHFNLDEDLSI